MGEGHGCAVVLLNLGGPDSLEAVEPFLFNLFSDPDLMPLPLGALYRRPLARLIARRRAPESRRMYAAIGGRSPILERTAEQAQLLAERLGPGFTVHVGMRAWRPSIAQAVSEVRQVGAERVVALSLYPQRSSTTTGSALKELRRQLALQGLGALPLVEIAEYPDEPGLVSAWVERIEQSLSALPDSRRAAAHLLFSAHGLPQRLVDRGDPYLDHVRRTVAAVMARLEPRASSLAFQSRATPMRWLGPETGDELVRLARAGVADVLVVPIAFLSDHLETLYELDQLLAARARAAGLAGYHRVAALNDSATLIGALEALVRRALAPSPGSSAR